MFQLRLKTALTNEAEILQNLMMYQYVNRCDYNFIYLLSVFVLMMVSLKKSWYLLHNMTSHYSFHEKLSREIRVSSNLVSYRERDAIQIPGNSNFV